jgi:hypothetical protein
MLHAEMRKSSWESNERAYWQAVPVLAARIMQQKGENSTRRSRALMSRHTGRTCPYRRSYRPLLRDEENTKVTREFNDLSYGQAMPISLAVSISSVAKKT